MIAIFWRLTSFALTLPILVIYAIKQTGLISEVADKILSKGLFVGCAIALCWILILREKRAYFLVLPISYGAIVTLDATAKDLDVDFLYFIVWALCGGCLVILDRRASSSK
ncbi:MAG: hypothetical protein V4475_21660 [Pseudomonadota bacterium]